MSLIQLKRGDEASIPVLAEGEPGFCTDTYKLFIGDGATNHEIGGLGGSVDASEVTVSGGGDGDVMICSSGVMAPSTNLNLDGGVGFFGVTPSPQWGAVADTSGATLGDLEGEVNALKQLLRDFGLLGT